jgi:hypothetical protein
MVIEEMSGGFEKTTARVARFRIGRERGVGQGGVVDLLHACAMRLLGAFEYEQCQRIVGNMGLWRNWDWEQVRGEDMQEESSRVQTD